mmetsp:Transcript_52807/g.83850  ORF Transcript_52807/g.83850 Transcript_52807/m.83850 type:complete len:315 (-) Transcript_52807:66-1010(-)|eukprot:CAMPEP_0169179196 /NCGR_PEP_ID=MMETSP1015-20121227/67511_1 /TAXON_ID=342587 /ORGANISM="Karlodinium micrum, Strain CCMP2283" /LENGTH=314 /DNA_ID=CAMNT_0009254227 /DNA_START=55 /DNA_END=999 /DNA_ORIENTATION=+
MAPGQVVAPGRRGMFTRQTSAPAKSSCMLVGATRLPSCKEVDADTSDPEWSPRSSEDDGINADHVSNLEQDVFMMSSNAFKRQVSAPASPGSVLIGHNRLPSCEEIVPDEPEFEPDEDDLGDEVDHFQSMLAPTRQMSAMSSFSAKGPSRQVSAVSNWSAQDWEPIGVSSIQRQETDERWPAYDGKDALAPADSEQLGSVSHGSEPASEPCVYTWMVPNVGNDHIDMNSVTVMPLTCSPMYTWQFVAPTKPQDQADLKYGRKRESLIDLAKQQQEQKSGNQGEAPKSTSIKFCPWCGGRFQSSFKFCVFCGNAV